MLCVLVMLKVKDAANVETVRDLLSTQGRLSREEPGCLRFEVYHSQNDPTRFVLCEHWDSQGALDVHRTAQAYTTVYQPRVLPLVDREPHPSTLVV
jgi:quinol monooxygenase YgiN